MRRVGLVIAMLVLVAVPLLAQDRDEKRRSYVVGFAQDTLENDWRSAQVRELQQAFAAYPEVRFIYTDARGRTAQQIQDVEDLIDRGVDVLITSPRDGMAMEPATTAIFRSGVPVVLLTRRVPGDEYTSYIAPDDMAIAARAADLLARELKEEGRIVVLQGVPTATTAINRTRGFTERLKKYPQMKIVAMPVGNYLRADALHEMERLLAEGVRFDAIFSESDSMAAGARLALRAAGVDPKKVPLVGIDYIPEARDAIRSGEQLASFTYPTCGREAARQVMKILRGETFTRNLTVESVMVTRSNVEKVKTIF